VSKVYDVVAVTGTYTKDGVEKPIWKNCGVVVKTEKGLSMKLDLVPVGEWSGWFKLFEPKAKEEQPPKPAETPAADFDSDIPF
jgi:hypothetical protein